MTIQKKSPVVGESHTVQVNAAMPPTEADKIWAEIKDKQVALFALGGKRVSDWASPHPCEPTKLFLTTNAPSLLPELEAVIGSAYVCEKQDRFIVISRAEKLPGQK
jgi:hypothetical protein